MRFEVVTSDAKLQGMDEALQTCLQQATTSSNPGMYIRAEFSGHCSGNSIEPVRTVLYIAPRFPNLAATSTILILCVYVQNDMTREKSAAAESFASHVACDSSVKASSMSPDQREQAAVEAQYIELYLMKYICTVPDCFGTFVPKDNHPTRDNNGSSSRSMTCNVCGNERTEEEFMSVVQKLLSESSD